MLGGLRERLLVAFVLLGVCTAVLVAGVAYVQARREILQRTQDAAVRTLTERARTLPPVTALPPGQAELDGIAARLSDRDGLTFAVYRDLRSRGARTWTCWRPGCGRPSARATWSGSGRPTAGSRCWSSAPRCGS